MLRLRPLAVLLSLALALCLLGLWSARSQTGGLRRVTNTTEEGVNVNPSLSGDGRRISFESTKDLAGAGGNGFHALRADLSSDPATFVQMGVTRAPAAGISQDGSIIAFASKDNPLGTNTDGNSEIYLYNGATLRQITNTTPSSASERTRQGNFQPSLTDDGRFIAFSSNRNLANQNGDGNLEIFIFDTASNTFTQLTNTAGAVGASDAKISGDGTRVAYIRDTNALPAVQRDLMLQDRAGATVRILASNVTNLAFTYGRAISDDGLRIVYSADIAANSSQVFLFDGRTTNSTRQITALGVRDTEVPLHPTISGDGTRIAFATRRPVTTAGTNSDNSVELYTYDIPTGQFGRVTNVTSSVADGFDGSNRAAEVVSSLNDDGSIVAFNFPRTLSGAVTSGFENNTEIYVTGTAVRPTTGALTILNEASFGHEPSTTKAVAPDSRAVALGGALAFNTIQAHPDANGNYPTTLDGTSVTVNGRPAQIFFVSPEQVNFLIPAQTELGTATVVVTNAEGFQSRGTVTVLRAAPGIFTESRDGQGPAVVLNADTGTGGGSFDPSSGNLRLVIFTTGVRKAVQVTATAGGRALTVESVTQSPDMPGMDEVRVLVPADLRGAGQVDLVVRADNRDSNPATVFFSGNACHDIVINEVLADPPDGIEGDANHDGGRNSNEDEFVELVNTTTIDKDISGYQLLARSTSSSTDTVRHTFAAGTIFPAGSAIVIFGGGVEPNFNPANPVFGGAQVFKASSGGLSLTNSGGVITLREPSLSIASIFSYGASTGLNGDANQSLTRSPDAGVNSECGGFVLHSTVPGSNGNPFSPGTHIDGSPFAPGLGRLTSVTISPPSSSVAVGRTTQFTAQARDQFGRPITNATITFVSDNTTVATIDSVTKDPATGIATATVTGRSEGIAHITAQATDGTTTITSGQATLTVNPIPAVVTRVEVSPPNAAINRGQTQQFTATAFDQNNQPIAGATFTWTSSDTNIATINSSGLATGVGLGSVTITATTSDATGATVSGTASLAVQVPLVINEILPQVPTDNLSTPAIEGDSNRDGTRDSDDDEFIELLNNSNAPVNISGVIISDSTNNRFTFPANTTLAAGRAVIVFGGGSPPANDPAFGGALIFTTSSLGMTDGGDTIRVKLPVAGTDVTIDSLAYGTGNPIPAPGTQSLTHSPDVEIGTTGGNFITHATATNAAGRVFSPGTRADGTPFGSPPITRIEVTPASATINIGQTQSFTARAFSNTGGLEIEIQNVSFIWDSSDTAKATVSPATGQSTTATALSDGTTTMRARAGGQQGTASLTINPPPPTISINDVSLNEGNTGTTTTFTFTVSLSSPAPAGGVTFNIGTQDNTATIADNDYIARNLSTQIIPAGSQTYTFDVVVNGDINIEPSETFFVNLTNVSGATLLDGQGIGTIQNDDSPTLSITDVSANEGNAGTTIFTFTVSLTVPAQAGGVTFDIATADGTATTANNDYVGRSLTGQTIPAGQQTYTFDVTVNGDTFVEPNETFFVNVSNVAGASVADAQGLGTIQNDDAANLVISQVYGGGGNSGATYTHDFIEIFNRGTTTVNFTVTPYSVQYAGATSNFTTNLTVINTGTIAPGGYFLIQEFAPSSPAGVVLPTPDASGTINLAATGGKVALVSGTAAVSTVACPGDDLSTTPTNPSGNNIVDFLGYGSGATCYEGAAPAPAHTNTTADFRKAGGCVDTNDNAADFLVASPNPRNSASPLNDCSAGIKPEITINDVSVSESTANATFTVTLSTASTLTVTVNYATADGTAIAGADYQPTSGTLTFNPGETTKSILVPIINDTLDEASETFFVNLTNAANSVILDNQGQGTISDNDAAPTISINDVSVAEGNAGTTSANFTVTLSAVSGQTVTVNYATADDTATAGTDYAAASGTLTFTPGQTTQTITVLVSGDTDFEQSETFSVNLATPANATISDGIGQGTITNDDAAPPTPALSINDVSVTEGDSGTKTLDFTVSLSPVSSGTVTVDYSTANGTATAGSDYQATSGTLSFNPGDATKTISVTINGDTLVEPNETFFVNLTNASPNAIVLDNQGQGTITNDDTANLVISQVYGGGGNSSVSGGTAPYINDFIEIYNRGTTIVDFSVTNYSVQYASAGANFGSTTAANKTNLTSGTIAPGRYFLIQEASGGASGVALPTPDATGTIALGNTSGKVALVANTAPLPAEICPGDDGNTPFNPNNAAIADFIGYGSVVCYEGSGPATAPGNATADFRKAGGCTDTNDNATDFFTHTPAPRNSGAPANNCSAGILPLLSIDTVSVTEGNSGTITATFTVSLSSPASGSDVTFDIATQNGTATSGSDYVAKTLTGQIIPAGQQTYTFSVTVNGDTVVETDETFFVNVTNVSGASVVNGQGIGTIQNDDLPTLSINDVTQAEGNAGATTFTFTVQLSAPAPAPVTFDIATADDTATTANNDYIARNLTGQTIAAGQQSYTFDVTVNGDTVIEPTETFFVNVTNISGATALDSQGLGTIQNDDSPALSINDVAKDEGNAGTTTFSFTVHLSVPAPAGGVTFDISTVDGTAQDDNPATEDNDYAAKSLTAQTIPEGSQDYTFDVLVNGDTVVEPGETFSVNLSNPVGATILDGTGQGTIQNDEAAADLVISQVYGGGGNGSAIYTNDFVEIFNQGTSTVNFAFTPYSIQYAGAGSNFSTNLTVINSGTIAPGGYFLVQEASSGAVGAALPTSDASGSIDLAATAGKVALVAGTTAVSPTACPGDDLSTVPTNPSGNNIVDFVGYGTTASCYEGTGRAPAPSNTTADIRKAGGCLDTDQNATDFFVYTPTPRNPSYPTNDCSGGLRPDITINDRTLSEGTTPHNFTVTLSMASAQTVTVNYSTANGTATAGSDYTATSGMLTFLAGETTKTINVPVINDSLNEVNETYFVNLSNASNGLILDSQGLGTITDNDVAPTLSINDVSVTEGDSGTKTLDFTVTLSAASGQNVTVNYATADETATAGTDYVAASGTLTFLAGETTKTVSVTINGDTVVEPNETFVVNLTTPVNATITDGIGQGTITNDDVTPSLSITDVTANEGNAGTTAFTFTVSLSPSSTQTVTVNYATADGTATAPSDYTAIATTQLTFAPGETSKQVTVQVNGDTTVEGNETFFVNLSNPTNATITDNQGVGTITNDDSAAASADLSLTKTVSNSSPVFGQSITFTIKISNGGPDPATGVQVTDLLQSINFTSVSGTATQGSYDSTTGVWTVGTVAVGTDAATLTITATVASGGPKTNTAEITVSGTADPDSTPNNRATAPSEDDTVTISFTAYDVAVINEFAVNPAAGNGREYIELLVTAPGGADLRGFVLSDVGGRTGTPGTSEGDITLGTNSFLSNVPQGTYVVIELTVPTGTSNTSTLTEDISTADGNRKLVLKTTGITRTNTFDMLLGGENIQLYGPRGRATGRVVDQVLIGSSQDLVFGTDGSIQAPWGDNVATTTTDNIGQSSGLSGNPSVAFCPTADTLAEFQNNDTRTRFTITASSYGTPGVKNTCVTTDESINNH